MASGPLADSSYHRTPTDSNCPCYCSCHSCCRHCSGWTIPHCPHCASKCRCSGDCCPVSDPDCCYSIRYYCSVAHRSAGTPPGRPSPFDCRPRWKCRSWICSPVSPVLSRHSRSSAPNRPRTRDAAGAGTCYHPPQSQGANAVAVW